MHQRSSRGLRAGLALAAVLAVVTSCAQTVGGTGVAAPVGASPVSTAGDAPPPSTAAASTAAPPTSVPPTSVPPTSVPPTSGPITSAPATPAPVATSTTTAGLQNNSTTPVPKPAWKLPAVDNQPAATNEFGDVKAKLGTVYGLYTTKDTPEREVVAFVVDKIQVDPGCGTPRAGDTTPKPVNGHFVVITLRVEVRDSTPQELLDFNVGFTRGRWTAYRADGTAEIGVDSSTVSDCLVDSDLPYSGDLVQPGVTKGTVVLDVTATKGTLVLETGTDSSWEYNFG